MNTTVYQHPDGHSIMLSPGALTITNDEGKSISIPIGPHGVCLLADALTEASGGTDSTTQGAQYEQHNPFSI